MISTHSLFEGMVTTQIYTWSTDKGKEHSYNVSDIWKLTKNHKQITIPVDRFVLDEHIWFTKYSTPSPSEVLKHTNRILSADLKYPILLDVHFIKPGKKIKHGIIDGAHRILLAMYKKKKNIKAILVDLDDMPEIKNKK